MLPHVACRLQRRIEVRGLNASHWSPYAVGAGIGVLSWFAFATVGRGLGITTPFEELAGMLERALAPGWTDTNEWFLENDPHVGWEWALVAGTVVGSAWSAGMGPARAHPLVPPLWRRRFGPATSRRLAWAFAGGAMMMFGARLAHGCTIGHGITGALTFAISSWAFLVISFATAAATAFTLFGDVGGGRARLPR